MKRYVRADTIASTANYLRENFPTYTSGMRSYEIDGKTITTNFLSMKKPYWNGYSQARGYQGPKPVSYGEFDACFDSLIDQGYTDIKIVEVPTSIHGLRKSYMWYR